MLVPDVRASVMKVEAADLGSRLRILAPEDRLAVLRALWDNAYFCIACGHDYREPHRQGCNCENDE